MFGASYVVKDNDKGKFVYCDYGNVFEGAESWSFGNDFTRHIRNFGAHNSLASHTDNRNNNLLVLGEGLLIILMVVTVLQRKSLVLTLLKQRRKLYLNFLYNCENNLENIYLSLKSLIKIYFFPTQVCLANTSEYFESKDISNLKIIPLNKTIFK